MPSLPPSLPAENLVNPEKLVIDLIPAECGPVEAAKGVLFVSVDKAMYKGARGGREGGRLPDTYTLTHIYIYTYTYIYICTWGL